jgi:hypothetical protein
VSEVDLIDAFTTETSCLTIVWAVMQDIRLPKIDSSWLKVQCSLSSRYQQLAEKGGSEGDVVSPSSWMAPEAQGAFVQVLRMLASASDPHGAELEQTVDQSASAPCLCMGTLRMRPRKATKQRERENHEAFFMGSVQKYYSVSKCNCRELHYSCT